MKNPIVLNDNYIDIDSVSFIGPIDSDVKAHINKVDYFFKIVVDGNELKITANSRSEVTALREQLLSHSGAKNEQKFNGLLPS